LGRRLEPFPSRQIEFVLWSCPGWEIFFQEILWFNRRVDERNA